MTSSRCILARDAGIPCYSVGGCGIPHHNKGGIRELGIGGYKSKCLSSQVNFSLAFNRTTCILAVFSFWSNFQKLLLNSKFKLK